MRGLYWGPDIVSAPVWGLRLTSYIVTGCRRRHDVFTPLSINLRAESGAHDGDPYVCTPYRQLLPLHSCWLGRSLGRRQGLQRPAGVCGSRGVCLPSDSCRWSQTPWQSGRGPAAWRWLFLPVSFPLFPSLLCGLPQHPNQPSASKVKSCQTWRRLPGFFSSLGFNKEKQITKMEIFKLAFSGIQIDVWVARRHRPHACYFVIKMIPKIPPCFGFSFSKTSCFFPSSNCPSPWGAATP